MSMPTKQGSADSTLDSTPLCLSALPTVRAATATRSTADNRVASVQEEEAEVNSTGHIRLACYACLSQQIKKKMPTVAYTRCRLCPGCCCCGVLWQAAVAASIWRVTNAISNATPPRATIHTPDSLATLSHPLWTVECP